MNLSNIALLSRLFKFASHHWGKLLIAGVMAVVLSPLSAILPYMTSIMVDEHIMKQDLPGLRRLAIYFIIILIGSTALKYYFTVLTNTLGQTIIQELRLKVFQKIMSFRLSYFDKSSIGTNTTRTINDLESINIVFSEGLITIVADILSLIMVLAFMFYTSAMLTWISLISFPLLLIASYIFKEKVKASYQRVRNEVAKMNSFLQEHISGMKVIQIFTAEQKAANKFRLINREYTQANLDGIFYYAVFFPVVEIISAASLGFMIWWGAKGVLSTDVTIGQLVAFPMFLSRLFQPVRMLADKFNTLQMGLIASQRVFQLLDLDESEYNNGTFTKNKVSGNIEFQNVQFCYEEGIPIIKNLSFKVKAGQSIAIVGSTGSGKTTLISLLNRQYVTQSGRILLDDVDINEYELGFLRRRFGLVLQDVFLFQGTILENISLKNESISRFEIIEACKSIGAHEYLDQLPGSYDYPVAERGANLSMGQRQLISFARALIYNPDVLILDEATSSIDTQTEQVIQDAISKLIKGRTSIVIAHRLSTIRMADRILVMENGNIAESGTHEELLSMDNGLYQQLYKAHLQYETF